MEFSRDLTHKLLDRCSIAVHSTRSVHHAQHVTKFLHLRGSRIMFLNSYPFFAWRVCLIFSKHVFKRNVPGPSPRRLESYMGNPTEDTRHQQLWSAGGSSSSEHPSSCKPQRFVDSAKRSTCDPSRSCCGKSRQPLRLLLTHRVTWQRIDPKSLPSLLSKNRLQSRGSNTPGMFRALWFSCFLGYPKKALHLPYLITCPPSPPG